jgi:hypothetical protein
MLDTARKASFVRMKLEDGGVFLDDIQWKRTLLRRS